MRQARSVLAGDTAPPSAPWRRSATGRRAAVGDRTGYDGLMSWGHWGRRAAVAGVVVLLAALVPGAACRDAPPEPITFVDRSIVVQNLTQDEWQNVEVWLNHHYRVTKSRMPPGERFSIPLSAFVAGFGQRFNAARQPIRGVEVNAVGPGGTKVRLVWGEGRRR